MRVKTALTASMVSALLLLAGCITGSAAGRDEKNKIAEIPKESNRGYNAHFCITENCTKIINHYLSNAQTSIHCAFYHVNVGSILKNLAEKSKSIDVRLVIDESDKDKTKGAKIAKSYGLMHNKFCIIDNELVITGSFNPTNSELLNDNNIFVVYSRLLAENYEKEFNELWNGISGGGDKTGNPVINYNGITIKNYFCPEDGCGEKIIAELGKAEKSIYFMAFSFTSEKIADALLFRKNIAISGVTEKSSANTEYSQYGRLTGFGIDVLKDGNRKTMHHKVFIIDNSTVITGSFNPTESADMRNDENIIIINDPVIAGKYLKEFERVRGIAAQ